MMRQSPSPPGVTDASISTASGESTSLHSATEPHGGALAGYSVEKIDTAEALADWGPKWRELEDKSGNTLPFRTHEWARVWWKHFCQDRRTMKDRLYVRAIRDPRGELIAIAPLMSTERPAIGPLRARCLQFFGPDEYVTEMGGMLCNPELDGAAYGALVAHLRANANTWDWILWSGLRRDGPSGQAAGSAGDLRWTSALPDYVLRLAPSWDEFHARLPRNIKESLRKCYNSLKRSGLDFTFHVAREPADLAPALDDFFRLHNARARLERTVPHKDFFQDHRARRFLVEVCNELSRRDAIRVFSLRINDKVIASRIGFVLGGSMYLYYSGYDPAFRRYSVMTTTVAEAIRFAIGEGLSSVNLSTGKDVSKTRWRPRAIVYAEALQLSGSFRARLAYAIYHHGRKALKLPGIREFASRYLWRRPD
jgi:CelD/BcsL family acetyltransferase involved in cellulose biosynthesis